MSSSSDWSRTPSSMRALGDRFWCPAVRWPPIAFVHTKEQADARRACRVQDRWTEVYMSLARRHDGTATAASKENFNGNYEGNWYYYCK